MTRWSNDGLGSRMLRAQTQPLLDSMLLGQVPRDLFLLVFARLQVLHGQALLPKCLQRRFPNALADPLDVLAVILKQNVVSPQVLFHSHGNRWPSRLWPARAQTPQRPPEYQPVKSRHDSLDVIPEFGDKLFHGVLLRVVFIAKKNTILQQENAFSSPTRQFAACRAVLSRQGTEPLSAAAGLGLLPGLRSSTAAAGLLGD